MPKTARGSKIFSRLLLGLVSIWFIAGAWFTSDGGISIPDLLGSMFGAIVCGVVWIVGVVFLARRRNARARFMTPSLIAVPILIVLGLGVHWLGAALPLRFAASQASLERYAASVLSSDLDSPNATRVGMFSVKETEAMENDVVRLITAECMVDECGFVYSPNGVPPRIGEDTYIHIKDDWFYWDRSW